MEPGELARILLPDGIDYGQVLRIVTADGAEFCGVYRGIIDADESASGLDEIRIDDGTVVYALTTDEIALVERADS